MFNLELIPVPQYVIKLLLLVGAAMLLHQITYRIFLPLFTKVSKKTRFTWDDYLIQRKVISRVFHLLPASVISLGIPVILDADTELFMILSRAVNVYYIVTGYSVFAALLNVVQDVFEENEISKRISIRGFVQAIKITVLLFSLILVISQIAGKSPLVFISGLGAFTAILMLVFKDSILGFVAGVQLTTMDLVRKGDWVEIPKHAADGDVIDLSLTTVRVRNWDKTITSIPAYELVSSSFKNWRGMSETGGRRIKRSILIDIRTIRFLKPDEIERLMKIRLLKDYLKRKQEEINKTNSSLYSSSELSIPVNGRHLTNVGTFRAYCESYLHNHSGIHQELTFLIRQLDPSTNGLPLEIYVFTNDVRWAVYEGIQADIFDHLLAILPEFGLQAFQIPSGSDLEKLRTEAFSV